MKTFLLASTLAAALAAVSLPTVARADAERYRCRGPAAGPIVAVSSSHRACDGYTRTGTKAAVRFERPRSGTLLTSPDGRTVVMVHDHIAGGRTRTGGLYEVTPDGTRHDDPVAIDVYRDDKLVAQHHLGALVARPHLVRETTSHLRWLAGAARVGADTFELTTLSFRVLTFSTITGALTNARDSDTWTRCAELAMGTVDLVGGRLVSPYSLKANARVGTIHFTRGPAVQLTHRATTTACFERGPAGLVLVSTPGWM